MLAVAFFCAFGLWLRRIAPSASEPRWQPRRLRQGAGTAGELLDLAGAGCGGGLAMIARIKPAIKGWNERRAA